MDTWLSWESNRGHRAPKLSRHLHLSALCPPPSAPWAVLPPPPGSEVRVQSLLPGLGQPGHCDPSCFLPEAQPAYLLILPLISHLSTSPPPPRSFKPGKGAPNVGVGPSPALDALPPTPPPTGSSEVGQLTPGRHLLLGPRDLLGTSRRPARSGASGQSPAPRGSFRQATVSLSVTWAGW